MSRLDPSKLHVTFMPAVKREGPVASRHYTLTHSDFTGELFLSVGNEYDTKQVSGLYTRLMRDEVLAEWREDGGSPSLHVHCHISGGLVLGGAEWRESIFRREMRLVLEVIRLGDRKLFEQNPDLDWAPIVVHFRRSRSNEEKIEVWGSPGDFRV